jgi:hypothetical protein
MPSLGTLAANTRYIESPGASKTLRFGASALQCEATSWLIPLIEYSV